MNKQGNLEFKKIKKHEYISKKNKSWDKLDALFSRQILKGSQDFFFLFDILIFIYFFTMPMPAHILHLSPFLWHF